MSAVKQVNIILYIPFLFQSFVKAVREEAKNDGKTRNFLLESDSASSDSEPDEPDPGPSSSPLQTPTPPSRCPPSLPAPSLGPSTPNKLPPPPLNACSDTSVFANPFKAQADQKLSALQKHVPLTMQAKPSQIGGKRVCTSYRKDGRCRFGIKCKFAHDSDLQIPVTPDCRPAVNNEEALEHVQPHAGGGSQTVAGEEESAGQRVKKRKVGLSNTLVPPKRALKQYTKLRDRDRINMS